MTGRCWECARADLLAASHLSPTHLAQTTSDSSEIPCMRNLDTPTTPEEPMQLGRVKVSAEEWQRRIRTADCLYCCQAGHDVVNCPVRPKGGALQ